MLIILNLRVYKRIKQFEATLTSDALRVCFTSNRSTNNSREEGRNSGNEGGHRGGGGEANGFGGGGGGGGGAHHSLSHLVKKILCSTDVFALSIEIFYSCARRLDLKMNLKKQFVPLLLFSVLPTPAPAMPASAAPLEEERGGAGRKGTKRGGKAKSNFMARPFIIFLDYFWEWQGREKGYNLNAPSNSPFLFLSIPAPFPTPPPPSGSSYHRTMAEGEGEEGHQPTTLT